MKQLGQDIDINDTSVGNKIKSSYGEQELDVLKDTKGVALGQYTGLFPTINYNSDREVFSVTGSFYSYLTAKYSKVNVLDKLIEAHSYFVSNAIVRRHHSSMKRYLEGWVSGDLLKLNRMKKSKPQISKDDFYKDYLNNEE